MIIDLGNLNEGHYTLSLKRYGRTDSQLMTIDTIGIVVYGDNSFAIYPDAKKPSKATEGFVETGIHVQRLIQKENG